MIDVEGRTQTGVLRALADDSLTILVGDAALKQATAELLLLNFSHQQADQADQDSVILLANGDRLVARPVNMNGEKLSVVSTNFSSSQDLRIPLEAIRGIELLPPKAKTARTRLFKLLLDGRQTHDVIYLRNGDRLSGELMDWDTSTLTLETATSQTKIERSGVQAVAFNSDLISFPKHEGSSVLITLTDSSRVSARHLSLNASGFLQMEALFGARLEVPLTKIAEIRFFGGRAVYLSDIEPEAYEFTPYLSTRWPLVRNRSVAGTPLRLRGTEYARGLGVHSQSVVTYRLDGKYRYFRTVVGLDDLAGERGSVVFRVEVDGSRVLKSPVLTVQSKSLEIGPVDLRGKQRLTLSVLFGPFGDIEDNADWCNAVLIK